MWYNKQNIVNPYHDTMFIEQCLGGFYEKNRCVGQCMPVAYRLQSKKPAHSSAKIDYGKMFVSPQRPSSDNLNQTETDSSRETEDANDKRNNTDTVGSTNEAERAQDVNLDDKLTAISGKEYAYRIEHKNNAGNNVGSVSQGQTQNGSQNKTTQTTLPSDSQVPKAQSDPQASNSRANASPSNPNLTVYDSNSDLAKTPLGDVCYLPCKQEENEKTKYDYGYRVVFRTDTNTYLLGIFPHVECEWNDINKECEKIKNRLEVDCSIVGAPSVDDLKAFVDNGIYLPGTYEMWTSTPTTENGTKAYYRNSKGAFRATKDKGEKCGVCVLIKVRTNQTDETLLSTGQGNFAEVKARLESEESKFSAS